MTEAYIVSAARTPIGRFGGALKDLSPTDLGAHAMKAALERAGVEGKELDLYIFGNVLRAGHGQLLPRQAAVKAGIPMDVDGYAIDMVCSSAMMTVMNAAMAIKSGEADLVLAGGMESMSQAGFSLSHRARWGYKFLMGTPEQLQDTLLYDGLTDPIENDGMGDETERLATEYEVTREELDTVAYNSHKRAAEATEKGLLQKEIAPIEVKVRRDTQLVDSDEGIRADTTMESLGKLRPAFSKEGVLTAGNSSQISDGAAALLLASEAAVEKHNLTPIGRYVSGAWAAVDSWRFVEAPVPAVKKLLGKLDKTINDFDLVENNEAFAVNSVLFNKVLQVPYDKMNVYGGGIALGHPIGCSGARIIVTLLNALEERDGKLGLASLCHGTGGGTAVAIERM
ncbi:MAG: thiolase family protein [Anaerolineae bacterium]|nr:thiolase family protein [Anaerolineae bacterium]